MVRAVRGATTVENNTQAEIISETKKLLQEIVKQNTIETEDIINIYFVVTNDLNACFPAKAARELGWTSIPLLDSVSPNVPGSLAKCIRIMLSFNSDKKLNEIKHVYLNKAVTLRPDLIHRG